MSELTVEQLIDDRKQYPEAVSEATKALARAKPWRGTDEERIQKLHAYHCALNAVYETEYGLEVHSLSADAATGGIQIDRTTETIVITGKISIVNYMHAYTLARGAGRREAFKWSLNLFKRCFPRSFERAEKVGPCLFKAGTTARLQAQLEADRERWTVADLPEEDESDEERDEAGEL